jgi:hypothetical protein
MNDNIDGVVGAHSNKNVYFEHTDGFLYLDKRNLKINGYENNQRKNEPRLLQNLGNKDMQRIKYVFPENNSNIGVVGAYSISNVYFEHTDGFLYLDNRNSKINGFENNKRENEPKLFQNLGYKDMQRIKHIFPENNSKLGNMDVYRFQTRSQSRMPLTKSEINQNQKHYLS